MQTTSDLSLSDLDLPFNESPIMNYHDAAMLTVGNRLVVGYLADEHDCENPLESCDGMGKVFTAHRWSTTQSEMREALALDSEWSPDLDLVDEHKSRLRAAWIETAMYSPEFIVWADETAGARAGKNDAYYRRRAVKLWSETDGEYNYRSDCVQDFGFWDDVRTKVWNELRDEGAIGDKDVVVLDCYDHGGQSWSLSGQGMQCQFDTAKGGGVWVPDESAREEIERRAKVYAFGRIVQNGLWTRKSGKLRHIAILDEAYGSSESEGFNDWHEAFAWLEAKAKNLRLSRRKADRASQERRGRQRAAMELAQASLNTYNDWLAGNCYGIVTAVFTKVDEEGDEPTYEFESSNECWGFIGDDYAMEEAARAADESAKSFQAEAA